MTPQRAKEIWLQAHQHYLAKTYGRYVTQVETLPDGRNMMTVDVGSLTPAQVSEVVGDYRSYLIRNPGNQVMFISTKL